MNTPMPKARPMVSQHNPKGDTLRFERALRAKRKTRYILRLYVAGITPRSAQAIKNIKGICEEHLQGRYDLQVIDVYQHPTLAEGEQIIAAPTLVKELPPPLRRFIGDLSNKEQVILGLDLRAAGNVGVTYGEET